MIRHPVFFVMVFSLTLLVGCAMPLHRDEGTRGAFEAGHHLLAANETEQRGYGLYSYLLFAAVPTDANRDHYLQAIAAIIAIPDVRLLVQAGFQPRELNITSIPVRSPLRVGEKHLLQQDIARMSEWILEHYDYARARYLLSRLPGTHESGPYIFSTFSPLEGKEKMVESFLCQDFSRVPNSRPGLTYAWVREFLERANQPRLWNEWTMKVFVQKFRLAIAVLGENVPPVIDAMEKLIKWTNHGSNNRGDSTG